MTNWYAVYTRPRCEKKVADNFLRKNIESYCPMQQSQRQWLGKMGTAKALFPCYVFIRLSETQLNEAKKTDGVVSLLYWLGKPAVIRDIEIEMLRRFINVHPDVHVEHTHVDTTGMVKLIQAPVVQKEGDVIAVGAGSEKLLLPSLGWLLTAVPQFQIQTQALLQIPHQAEMKIS